MQKEKNGHFKKGNEYWKLVQNPGKPRKYSPEEVLKLALEYAQWCSDNPLIEEKAFGSKYIAKLNKMRAMTIQGFCLFADMNPSQWYTYEKHADYKESIARAKTIFYTQKLEGAAAGFLNERIIATELANTSPGGTQHVNMSIMAGDVTNIFIKNYHSARDEINITINRGGTSSSKTFSLAQIALHFLLTGRIGNKIGKEFDIVSGTLPHLKATAIKDLQSLITVNGFENIFEESKTEKVFKYQGRALYYYSVDETKKVKGRRRDFLWISEADSIDYEIFRQMQLRTNLHTFLDFNPDNEYIWINEELEKKRMPEIGDIEVIQSSYIENIFLNEKIINEIELLRESDPEYWQIYGLGNYGSIAGLIFKDWTEFDTYPSAKLISFYGQDYGFSNSRDAMLKISWEIGTKNLYLEECYYELGLNTGQLIDRTKEANPDNDPVYGDCAEARLMHELRSAGINLFKPKKAVLSSINLLKSFNLYVHSGSPNLLKEFKVYKWDKQDGQRINKPLKFMDHLMNAAQYAITGFISMYGRRYKILSGLAGKTNDNIRTTGKESGNNQEP